MRATTLRILALLICLSFALESGVSAGPPPTIGGAGSVTPPPRSPSITDTVFNNLRITPQGTTATITFTTTQSVRAGASYNATSGTAAPAQPVVGASSPAGPVTINGQPPAKAPEGDSPGFTGFITPQGTSHTITLTGLKSNTHYTTRIWIDNGAGAQAQSTEWTFLTLKRRIKITFPSAHITDNGDIIGAGEPLWTFEVSWAGGQWSSCYPYDKEAAHAGATTYQCFPGDTSDVDSASNYYFTNSSGGQVGFILPEENFGGALPTTLMIRIPVEEYDIIPFPFGLPSSWGANGATPVDVSQSGAQIIVLDSNNVSEGFYSTVTVKIEVYYDKTTYPATPPVIDLFT